MQSACRDEAYLIRRENVPHLGNFYALFVAILLSLFTVMPAPVQAQDEASPYTVQFNGHSFDVPTSLGDGVSAFRVNAPSAPAVGSDELQPPRTEFRLQFYTDEVGGSRPTAWVNIFDASDLEGYPTAYEQYEHLRRLLSERPDLNAEASLPTLYPYQASALPPDRYSEFFVNAAYLESEGYQGITYIYARVVRAGTREPIVFYRVYFEGISPDEQRYLSAQVEGLQELLVPLEGVTDYDDYFAQVQALFHQPTDEAVIGWLDQANVLFSSFDYATQP